jgi:hypothetical protein
LKIDRSVNRQSRAKVASIPAPIGGWNQRDSLASMPSSDAVILDNWYPTPYDVGVRAGSSSWSTGLPGNVETVAAYNAATTTKLFGVSNGAIYDCTSKGAVGAAMVSGLSNSRFQKANMGTAGGQFLVMVNGLDLMQVYNGNGWASIGNGTGAVISTGTAVGTVCTITTATPHNLATGMTVTVAGATPGGYNGSNYPITVTGANSFTYTSGSAPGGAMTVIGTYTYSPSVSGIATSSWSNVCMHKQRLWFVERNSLRGWYLPTSSIGGAAVQFDFSSLFRQGGYIVTMGVWTLDAGYGIDDMLIIMTSKGEVAVYKGTDPNSTTTWAMVGMYSIGSPMSARCMLKFAGDALIVNRDGLVPLSGALQSSRIEVAEALSDKIQWAISTATTNYAGNFGWEIALFPSQNMVLVNVPINGTLSHQYVMNTVSKAWCRFKGWNAYAFELFNDNLYFGASTKVYKAWDGLSDDGAYIFSEALQAFSDFGTPGQRKRTMQVRPMLQWDGRPLLNLGVNADFDQSQPTGVITANAIPQTVWDGATSKWDANGTVWMGDPSFQTGWQTSYASGFRLALHLLSASNSQQLRWASTDYTFELGGVL